MWQRAIITSKKYPQFHGKKVWTQGKPFETRCTDIFTFECRTILAIKVNIKPEVTEVSVISWDLLELLNEFSEIDPSYITWKELEEQQLPNVAKSYYR